MRDGRGMALRLLGIVLTGDESPSTRREQY